MSDSAQNGRARMTGCSNFNIQQLREAVQITSTRGLKPIEMIQPVYNLVRREIDSEVLPFCREHNIAVVTYSPLGAGFLSGKYGPGAAVPAGARFDLIPGHADEYYSERNFEIVERLRVLAAGTACPWSAWPWLG